MLPAMARKPSVAIVGPGRLGAVLAEALRAAGYRVEELISRNPQHHRPLARRLHTQSVSIDRARLTADLVWFCVPDREIEKAAGQLANHASWKGKLAFHSSGALTSDALGVLRCNGATVASVHPLMTFVGRSDTSLTGVPFGIEGDASATRAARKIVRELGGNSFAVSKKNKVLYHGWGTFLSPLFISLLVASERVANNAGIPPHAARQKALPILRQTLENYAAFGAAQSFSGPIVRGDVATVRGHLQELKKSTGLRRVYAALARVALRHLPTEDRRGLERLLKQLS